MKYIVTLSNSKEVIIEAAQHLTGEAFTHFYSRVYGPYAMPTEKDTVASIKNSEIVSVIRSNK